MVVLAAFCVVSAVAFAKGWFVVAMVGVGGMVLVRVVGLKRVRDEGVDAEAMGDE